MTTERMVIVNPGDKLWPRAARRSKGSKMAATKKRRSTTKKATPRKRTAARKRTRNTTKPAAPKRRRRRTANTKPAAPRRRTTTRRRRRTQNARTASPPVRRRRRRAAAPSPNPVRRRRRRAASKAPVRRYARTASKRRGRKRNPGLFGGGGGTFIASLKTAGQVAAVLIPLRAAINYLGAWPTKKDDAGNVQETLSQKIGPLFDVGISALALWAVPKYVMRGPLAKYRATGQIALQANLVISVMRTVAWYARRGWDATKDAAATSSEEYPRWTDFLEFPEPQRKSVQGVPWARREGLRGAPVRGQLGRGRARGLVFDPNMGRYVEAGAY